MISKECPCAAYELWKMNGLLTLFYFYDIQKLTEAMSEDEDCSECELFKALNNE